MKPFDLELASQGNPVVTRSGDKAYITHDNRDTAHNLGIKLKNSYAFSGFVYRPVDGKYDAVTWTVNGMAWDDSGTHFDDIVGMWEPQTTINVFGVDGPAPYAEAPPMNTEYYTANISCPAESEDAIKHHTWHGHAGDMHRLRLGLVFKSEEDARAYHAAMMQRLAEEFDAEKELLK